MQPVQKLTSGLLGGGPDIPPPTPPAPPPAVPTVDDARRRREAADAANRKRGRQATIFTGSEGVGNTPTGTKTLIGS